MANKQERIEKRKKIRDMQKKKKTLEEQLDELENETDDELDLAHIQDDEDDGKPEPVVPDVSNDEVPEIKQKDMAMMGDSAPMAMPSMPPMPKSWDELDQLEQAQEQAGELRELGWNVQDLVYNIVSCGDMTPADKASAIQNVGVGFGDRVQNVLATGDEEGNSTDTQKEMDILAINALQAHDSRQMTIGDRVSAIVEKAVLNAKRENALSDAQFALVRTMPDGTKVRKYPIMDKAHVRNALARAAQMMAAGGQAAKDAKAAMPKIRAAAKRMGIEMSIKKEIGDALLVEKDASGNWRWVGWATNNFIDTDQDIYCEEAHKEYVDWLDKNPDMAPVFVSWHTPGTAREKPVDFASYENGFLIVSGPLTETEAAGLLKARKNYEIGMSHGGFVLGRDPRDPRIVTKYRLYEVSDLPLERAANPFTLVETITEKEKTMVDKQKYLAAILGSDEKAKAFLEKTGIKQKELVEAGVEHKEKTDETPETPTPATADTSAILEQVKKELGIDDLNAWVEKAQESLEKLPLLEAAVKELSKTADEKVAKMIEPPASRYAWLTKQRPSEKQETQLQDSDPLNKEMPKKGWLSEVTGTEPIKIN